MTNPAPQAVYQTERWGAFTYTLPSLTPNAAYTVRLHFAENYWSSTGQRRFHVDINGVRVLTEFDIVAAAGGANRAVVREFATTANANGQIGITFITGSIDDPKSSGIEVVGGGPTPTPTPTSSSLVLALGFDENGGTTVADASGNNNNGTASNTTWTTGRYGSALSFNGTDSWVTVNDSNSLDLADGMTLEAWVYPTDCCRYLTILMKEYDAIYYLYADGASAGSPLVGVNIGGYQETYGPSDLPTNTWSHVAGTWDGSTLQVYVNGTLVASRAVSEMLTNTTNPLRIGGNSMWGEYLAGRIDEVRIYNRALSQSEIQNDMNTPIGAGSPTPTPTNTPVGPTSTPTPTNTPTRTPTPTATSASAGFPTMNVLDNFNRADGEIGSNWSGMTSGYSIASNRLDVGSGDDIGWSASSFGANCEPTRDWLHFCDKASVTRVSLGTDNG